MLPRSITEPNYPPDEEILRAISELERKDISPFVKVTVSRKHERKWYETEVDNVIGYDISEDRQFGASSLTLHCSNPNGIYSYANVNSSMNELFVHDSEVISVDLSEGEFTNCAIDSEWLKLINLDEPGEWVSTVMYGGVNFHSWRRLVWDIDPGKVVRGNVYYGYVNVFVRFGETLNVNDETWTVWQKVTSVTGETSNFNSQEYIASSRPYVQIKMELFAAFASESPAVKSIDLLKFSRQGSVIKNKPIYYYGNKVKVIEYVMNADGSFMLPIPVFTGFIDVANPTQTVGGELGLTVEALDMMKICLGDFIEKPKRDESGIFESKKSGKTDDGFDLVVTQMELLPVQPPGHDDNEDGIYDVIVHPEEVNSIYRVPIAYRNNGPIRGFEHGTGPKSDSRGDFLYQPWAQRPNPLIYVEDDNGVFQLATSGYQIDYERGVVYFNTVQTKPNNEPRKVKASFSWYDLTTNLFEDVVGEIIAEAMVKFGFKKPTRTRHIDAESNIAYDLWESEDADAPRIIIEHARPRTIIPPTSYSLDDRRTFFDALSDMLKYVTPDYMIRATPDGDIVGEYRPQEATAKYQLTLIENMDAPVTEEGIYTRCVARGVNPSMINIAPYMTMTPNIPQLVDGDYTNNYLRSWLYDPPSLPFEVVRFTAKDPIRIGSVSVLIGEGEGPPNGVGTYGDVNLSGVGLSIEVSTDGVTWYTLTQRVLSGSTGQWVFADKNDFYGDVIGVPFKYIRIMATSTHYGLWGGWAPEWLGGIQNAPHYQWAIREVQIHEDEEIRKEVSIFDLVDDPIYKLPREVANDMYDRLGEKTIVLSTDATLKNEDMVKARALDYLYEASRNLYRSDVTVIYAPHIRVGHTVSVRNPKLVATQSNQPVGRRLYYVDSVSRSMNNGAPSVSVSLVSWT